MYLAQLLTSANSSWNLSSVSSFGLFVPLVNSSVGQRSFYYYATALWSSLSSTATKADSLFEFRKNLKTYLFDLPDSDSPVDYKKSHKTVFFDPL